VEYARQQERKRYAENREKRTEYQRNYYAKNKEKIQERNKKWLSKNKEKRAEYDKDKAQRKQEELRLNAINSFLINDLKEFQPSVKEIVLDSRTFPLRNSGMKYVIFGGLLYVLIKRRGIPFKEAIKMLPREARCEGARPFKVCINIYNNLKKLF
jgi:hypothetical protein